MIVIPNHFGINILLIIFILKYGVLQSESVNAISQLFINNYPKLNVTMWNHKSKHNIFMFQDIPETVNYWLYTRERQDGQLLDRRDPTMINRTTFNKENPTKVVVHGWLGGIHESTGICTHMVNAYLEAGKYNVICLKWMKLSEDIAYPRATQKVKYISFDLAVVLMRITSNNIKDFENIHLIGYSLGAHIVGITGKLLNGRISRISGLDPAKPLYENSVAAERIDKGDGKFVDIIHSNTKMYGLNQILGHIDFFPNGGKLQPNCGISDKVSGGACSHIRAYQYFADAIIFKYKYKATQCSSWENYEAKKCNSIFAKSSYMGEYVDKKKTGTYYLTIGETVI